MAKKKSIFRFGPLVAAFFGLVALITLFLPAVVQTIPATILTEESVTSFNGLKVVFGYTKTVETNIGIGTLVNEVEYFKFSFMNLLPFALVLVGIVASLLAYAKKNKIATLVALVCFIGAAVLFFFTVNFVQLPTGDLEGEEKAEAIAKIKEYLSIGAGAIIAAVSSIVAGLGIVSGAILDK